MKTYRLPLWRFPLAMPIIALVWALIKSWDQISAILSMGVAEWWRDIIYRSDISYLNVVLLLLTAACLVTRLAKRYQASSVLMFVVCIICMVFAVLSYVNEFDAFSGTRLEVLFRLFKYIVLIAICIFLVIMFFCRTSVIRSRRTQLSCAVCVAFLAVSSFLERLMTAPGYLSHFWRQYRWNVDGIIFWILIILIISTARRICPRCRDTLHKGTQFCASCGEPVLPFRTDAEKKKQKIIKIILLAGLSSVVLATIVVTVVVPGIRLLVIRSNIQSSKYEASYNTLRNMAFSFPEGLLYRNKIEDLMLDAAMTGFRAKDYDIYFSYYDDWAVSDAELQGNLQEEDYELYYESVNNYANADYEGYPEGRLRFKARFYQLLPNDYKDCAILKEAYKILSEDFTGEQVVSRLKPLATESKDVQDYLMSDDLIDYFLIGEWRCQDEWIWFSKEDDNISFSSTLPNILDGIDRYNKEIYWTLYDRILSYHESKDDGTDLELGEAFNFEFISTDKIKVYCYRDQKTYEFIREN